MRVLCLLISLSFPISMASGQGSATAPAFDVASVRPSQHAVGPDYNNQLTYTPGEFTAKNVTVKRLIAEAYRLQLDQIQGPGWLDQNEYEVEARADGGASREQMAAMLRSLLAERFKLKEHSETREMRVYALVVGNSGAKIHPLKGGETVRPEAGFHFHGDLRQLADLLAVQLSIPAPQNPNVPSRASGLPIPVLDETGLPGIYDLSVNIRPEMGTDMLTAWQRVLDDQLGLKLESRKENMAVMIVDEAAKMPTEN